MSIFVNAQSEPIPKELLEAFPETYNDLLNHEIEDKYLENYAQDNANGKYKMTYFHNAYYDQPVLESYVRSILKKLDPSKADELDVPIYLKNEFLIPSVVNDLIEKNIEKVQVLKIRNY